MPTATAKWRPGARFRADPAEAHAFFESIRADYDGAIPLREVVDRSRDKSAPLHRDFEWDDKMAAEKHRLETARYAVRSLVIVEAKTERASRAYESVSVERAPALAPPVDTGTHVWRSAAEILEDADGRQWLLEQYARLCEALLKRRAQMEALGTWPSFDAIERDLYRARQMIDKGGENRPSA